MTQPGVDSDDPGSDSDVPQEDVDERAVLTRATMGIKQPVGINMSDLWCDEEEEEAIMEDAIVRESPDLGAYFAEFPSVDAWDRIRLCRTYANYLTQMIPKSSTKRRKK